MFYFFEDCETVEDIKKRYRKLLFEHHLNEEALKILNKQYHVALCSCDGQTTVGTDNKEHTYHYNEAVEQSIMDTINELLKLKMEGVDILLIGTWLWILNNTKPYKDSLKKLGCKWHSKRGCWYWRSPSNKHYRPSGGSLSELAAKYGCTHVEDLEEKKQKPRKPRKKRSLTA